MGNGTDALEMAVRALELGPSDTVIVPANTFIASALGVLRAGARVKLVDCQPDTYLIDPDQAMAAVDSSVRAVMPVHLYGQMAQMESLQFPERVAVIEDAAQSQGATRHGRGMGSFGRVAATSFYPGKNIGAYGDAGAVLTDDDALADQVRRLGNWGSAQKYHHPELGFNSRLDTVQAVVLSAKLERLAAWNEMRNAAAGRYAELLADEERVTLPVTLDGNLHVWHLYVIRVPRRDLVLARLMRVASVRVFTIRFRCTCRVHCPDSGMGQEASRSQSKRRTRSSPFRSSQGSLTHNRRGLRLHCDRLSGADHAGFCIHPPSSSGRVGVCRRGDAGLGVRPCHAGSRDRA